jgi:hypothetical protein
LTVLENAEEDMAYGHASEVAAKAAEYSSSAVSIADSAARQTWECAMAAEVQDDERALAALEAAREAAGKAAEKAARAAALAEAHACELQAEPATELADPEKVELAQAQAAEVAGTQKSALAAAQGAARAADKLQSQAAELAAAAASAVVVAEAAAQALEHSSAALDVVKRRWGAAGGVQAGATQDAAWIQARTAARSRAVDIKGDAQVVASEALMTASQALLYFNSREPVAAQPEAPEEAAA